MAALQAENELLSSELIVLKALAVERDALFVLCWAMVSKSGGPVAALLKQNADGLLMTAAQRAVVFGLQE